MTEALRFYSHTRGDLRALSNFYPSTIALGGFTCPTAEHYFQAMKFADSARQLEILRTPDPADAKRLGRLPGMRRDWDTVRNAVMLEALRAKFTQHSLLRSVLLSTDKAMLIEAAPRDYYWGEGADRSGKNMLGLLLMVVRAELS